jgi:hypothetical protein
MERRRSGHPHPQASQGGVREAEIVIADPLVFSRICAMFHKTRGFACRKWCEIRERMQPFQVSEIIGRTSTGGQLLQANTLQDSLS